MIRPVLLVALLLPLAACTASTAPSPRAEGSGAAASITKPAAYRDGNKAIYRDPDGGIHMIAATNATDEPALSNDGKWVAWVGTEQDSSAQDPAICSYCGDKVDGSALFMTNVEDGSVHKVASPYSGETTETYFWRFWNPHFSPDDDYIYLEASAWVTSGAVHRVTVSDGSHQFITDGAIVGIIGSGRYRGHLLVQRHEYGSHGATAPSYIVSSDGSELLLVPGSDDDDSWQYAIDYAASQGWELY